MGADMTNREFSLLMFGGISLAILLAVAVGRQGDAPPPEPEPPSAVPAMVACEGALRDLASHPSTVSFHWTGGSQTQQNGGWLIKKAFSAKNSYGLEVEAVGLCLVGADDKVIWSHAAEQ